MSFTHRFASYHLHDSDVRTTGRAAEQLPRRRRAEMFERAAQQPGFLGVESAHEDVGITVSYWADEAAALAWKDDTEHRIARQRGRTDWYSEYEARVATVTRQHGFGADRRP